MIYGILNEKYLAYRYVIF